MPDKIEQLRDIFANLPNHGTFVERQQSPRGVYPETTDADTALLAVIDDLRARFPFRTTLSDADLVAIVRGFYTGRTDADLAADLGVSSNVVSRARVNLHLFRETDVDRSIDRHTLTRLLDADASVATVAAELDVDRRTAGHVRHVAERMRGAQRVNHRYQTDFESILADSEFEDDLRESVASDRQVFRWVKE